MDLAINIHPALVVVLVTAFVALRIMRFEAKSNRFKKKPKV
jgi:hypothetical protein